jgi:hypothetical protein
MDIDGLRSSIDRCLASRAEVKARLTLLQAVGAEGDVALEAVPDVKIRLRLVEAHALEVARIERLLRGLLGDLETVHGTMVARLDDGSKSNSSIPRQAQEDEENQNLISVISHDLWRTEERFAALG